MTYEVTTSHSIDPLINYKGRYNRDSWHRLKLHGTLFLLVDTTHYMFDVNLRSIENGDIIRSTNDGIDYVVLNVHKNEGTNVTRWITMQPLFCAENWFGYGGLFRNILLDGNVLPIIKE